MLRSWQPTPPGSDSGEGNGACSPTLFAPQTVKQRCPREFSFPESYEHFRKKGYDFGSLFQGIEHVWQGEQEALGLVRLPDGLASEAADYLFHPALLDSCFQVAVAADRQFDTARALYLPAEIHRVRLFRRPGRRLWCHARLLEKRERWAVSDLDVIDESGQPVLSVRGLRGQFVAGSGTETNLEELFYEYRWQLQPPPASEQPATPGRWLVFADRSGVGEQLAGWLRGVGESCVLVFPGSAFAGDGEDRYQLNPGRQEELVQLLHAVLVLPQRQQPAPALRGIIHLWNLDAPATEGLNLAELESAQEAGLFSVLYLVQAWDKVAGDQSANLLLVTRGAQAVGAATGSVAVAQGPVIGLGRVIASEHSRLRCKLVDVDPENRDAAALFDELWAADEEDEVALRGLERHVHRYQPAKWDGSPEPSGRPGKAVLPSVPYRLTTPRPGTLDSLTLRSLSRRPPGHGEVEIEVVASGLNFSDVMKALGIYPGLPDGPVPLGIECSGRVTALGDAVPERHGGRSLQVGDEVLAIAPFAFSSHVTARAELVALKPARLSFEDAATIPLAFLTAVYALEHLAHLGAGERVLIHSATGGVGLAAIQLAQRAGAEIFATAGTPEKRQYLRDLGIKHVMDSRSVAFADEVLEQTGGRGVDVVLNSLAGEALIRSVDTLADHGRFLEIGKRDIYGNTRLGLRPFRKNLSFFAIDLDRMLRDRSPILGTLFQKLVQDVREGQLAPLPHRDFPIGDAVSGFRFMQHGKHLGKVVLSLRDRPAAIVPGEEPIRFRADGSYLILGGLGGFGLALARWLAERGAGQLVLVGRRGIHSPQARQAVAELEQLGARVRVMQADIAKEADVASVLAEIDRTLPPLRGVFHAAMVLEDALLANLDRDLMQRVIAPKMNGAWNLHRLTLDRPLDHFVLFSSLSSVFGHAGQGNYAAANTFLDILAHYRRARGLPCLTVNWGYLGDVGYLSERQQLGDRLSRQGVMSFTVKEALTLLERALQRQAVQISVMRMDWSLWRGLGLSGRVSPRFRHLLIEPDAARGGRGPDRAGLPTLDAVLDAAPEERPGMLETLLRDKVARILGTTPARVSCDRPLLTLGIDSLMAVELRNWIEGELRVNVPIVELMRSPTLFRLIEMVQEQLTNGSEALATVGAQATADSAGSLQITADQLANLEELSGEQVDALLTALLAERKGV